MSMRNATGESLMFLKSVLSAYFVNNYINNKFVYIANVLKKRYTTKYSNIILRFRITFVQNSV